ncbi:very-long-chain (3R)-3-hydroxyacyl-CoA dehydratase 2-like, partial [Sinocyclocheilus grahami]|uniref:very-long-chain (3R)-3-hydroxyacyl-CoA dehydratase 2-like n=1 Tax=Sinocyclocheilus grahami TaxID=75366 RepID=UPI0007ACDC3F
SIFVCRVASVNCDGTVANITAWFSTKFSCLLSSSVSSLCDLQFLSFQVQSEDSVLLFVVAWTVTEIIRYSFYTFSLLNHLPYLIKWARYTFFIVLYPMGVAGELLTIYAALPYVQKTGLYSITLPNKYNFSFDYHTFLILVMVSYIPLFPQLYFHMMRQRKKVLGHVEEYSKVE